MTEFEQVNINNPPDELALMELTFSELGPEARRANIIKNQELIPEAKYDFPDVSENSGLVCDAVPVENLSQRSNGYLFASGAYIGLSKQGYLLFRGVPLYEALMSTVNKAPLKSRENMKGKNEYYFPVKSGALDGTRIVPAENDDEWQEKFD